MLPDQRGELTYSLKNDLMIDFHARAIHCHLTSEHSYQEIHLVDI